MTRVLVACVGNIFLGDDGFGTEVAAALRRRTRRRRDRRSRCGWRTSGSAPCTWSTSCSSGYDVLVLVDTVAHQAGPAGTLYVIEPDAPALGRRATRCPR